MFSRAHKTHRLLIGGLVAIALLLCSAAVAAPAERIVIKGPETGTHLRLATDGANVVVIGPMSEELRGCRLVRGHMEAVCPFGEASAIEVETGPGNDFVQALDRLPFPLTVHLGDGEDKFIGNDEKDVCFPEGARRNRCVGEGGDDVCITGPENSDCVGGAGDDYCRHSDGSDGCWGGPGDDVCYMGPGQDGCHGEAGDDRLFGEHSADQLYGGEGDDYCDGGPGKGYSRSCESGPGQ